jgi:2,3-bisphosphoglycerate-independent phosphoglycerate mutase
MLTPLKKPKTKTNKVPQTSASKEISPGTSLGSHPIKIVVEESQKENEPPTLDEDAERAEAERKARELDDQASHAAPAPLEKLATRVKSILRRKTVNEKKSEKRRKNYHDLDRMEDVHWTEM